MNGANSKASSGRENDAFYNGVWSLLPHCHGLIIGEKINSKHRIDSEITLSQMTPGEQSFKLHVNHLLNLIQAPVFRQLTVEALRALAVIFQDNPDLRIDDTLFIDILIGHAVRLCWLESHPEHRGQYEANMYRWPGSRFINCRRMRWPTAFSML